MATNAIVKYTSECSRMTEIQLVAKTGTKSKAWDYCSLQKGADEKSLNNGCAICRTCHGRI